MTQEDNKLRKSKIKKLQGLSISRMRIRKEHTILRNFPLCSGF